MKPGKATFPKGCIMELIKTVVMWCVLGFLAMCVVVNLALWVAGCAIEVDVPEETALCEPTPTPTPADTVVPAPEGQ